ALRIPGLGAGARPPSRLLLGGRIGLAGVRGALSCSGLRWFCIGSVGRRRRRRIGRGRLGVERTAARPAEIVGPSGRRCDRLALGQHARGGCVDGGGGPAPPPPPPPRRPPWGAPAPPPRPP